MNSRSLTFAAIVAVLTAASYPLDEIAGPVGTLLLRDETQPAAASGILTERTIVSAALGGFRAPAADLAWLRVSSAVEERDEATTVAMLEWASVLEPDSLYFWLNGSRILAYDMPGWVVVRRGRDEAWQSAQCLAAQAAVRRLAEAMTYHPHSAALWIERANIELTRLGDVEAAAASYRHASEQPHAPFYAARLHGEMLRRLGRKSEALAWLIQLHPRLPAGDEAAAADLVLSRIRGLEKELGVAPKDAYRPLTSFTAHSFLRRC